MFSTLDKSTVSVPNAYVKRLLTRWPSTANSKNALPTDTLRILSCNQPLCLAWKKMPSCSCLNVLRSPGLPLTSMSVSTRQYGHDDSEASLSQVPLHCYALDCISHHLFHPYGTRSLAGKPDDVQTMKELTYHNSLKS